MEHHNLVDRWLHLMNSPETPIVAYPSSLGVNTLVSTATIHEILFGTGYSIFQNQILPAIEAAKEEVVLVTCFWAQSPTLSSLNTTLCRLSERCVGSGRRVRLSICFSSCSLFQKLFHTTSPQGRTYSPAEWESTLGLPGPNELAGLDVTVKSVFVLPFSVMHSKFIIIDRSVVFLPSCNVSWEDWFEGSVRITGPIILQFLKFWKEIWANDSDIEAFRSQAVKDSAETAAPLLYAKLLATQTFNLRKIPAIFLPSYHSRNPNFSWPWQTCPPPPATPLNVFLLTLLANARKEVYMQTPNLTSPPVLAALLSALKRGVNVRIVTSERLMIIEQLVTAGTTTKRCVRTLCKRHRRLVKSRHIVDPTDAESTPMISPGDLSVKFYQPNPEKTGEPVQSHVKLTVVDNEITVLGSGNQDRASWYTSQELGVAFFSEEFGTTITSQIDDLMRQRTR